MELTQFDTGVYRRLRLDAAEGKYAWKRADALTAGERTAWQEGFRRDFAAALGGLYEVHPHAYDGPDCAGIHAFVSQCHEDHALRATVFNDI